MSKAKHYDPMFYLCSEEMPFTIRVEFEMRDTVDGDALRSAVDTAIKRYPYFAVEVVRAGGELLCVSNSRPVAVLNSAVTPVLGSDAVNRHMNALTYYEKTICFFVSHVLTDGAGYYPFIKTTLYYYLCTLTGTALDATGIRLADEPFGKDETGDPFDEEKISAAVPLYIPAQREYFAPRDSVYVTDDNATVYRLRVSADEMMHYSYDHDGSPCSLVSSLLARAVWELHPDITSDIVSAVSFNMRPGLGIKSNYRMLCSALMLHYPEKLRGAEVAKLCTCSRGMVTLLSQPENVLYYAKRRRELMEHLLSLSTVEDKQSFCAPLALEDSTACTFSVSYVGDVGFGSLEPYIANTYNYTDGSTWRSVFVEIALINGCFYLAFQQGFSSDVYYRAFLRQLEQCGLRYIEEAPVPLDTPKIELP